MKIVLETKRDCRGHARVPTVIAVRETSWNSADLRGLGNNVGIVLWLNGVNRSEVFSYH